MSKCLACMYICALHVCSACRDQQKTLDPPELELMNGCESPIVLEIELGSSGRGFNALNSGAIFSGL